MASQDKELKEACAGHTTRQVRPGGRWVWGPLGVSGRARRACLRVAHQRVFSTNSNMSLVVSACSACLAHTNFQALEILGRVCSWKSMGTEPLSAKGIWVGAWTGQPLCSFLLHPETFHQPSHTPPPLSWNW